MRSALVLLVLLVLLSGCHRFCEKRPLPPPPEVSAATPTMGAITKEPVEAPSDPVDQARQAARAMRLDGNDDGALTALQSVLKRLPPGAERDDVACELAVLLNNRAARTLTEHPRAADDDSARAVKLCPRDEALRANRANLLYKRAADEDLKTSEGRARARAYLLDGIKLHDNASAHALLAEIFYADDQPALAAEHLRTAAKLSPDDSRIASRLEDIERKADVESSFKDNKHTHFVALFDGYGQERLAWTALDMLEQAYFSVGGQLDLFPRERITVVIYTGDQYKRAVNLPDWSTGAFDGKIRINEGQLQQDTGTLKSILRHEFTHAALATLNRPLPAWLNEGLAEFFEGSDPVRALNMSVNAKRNGTLVPFADLERASFVHIVDTDAAQLAYAQSLSMIHRLVDKRGVYALQGFISRLEVGEDLQTAFVSAYAITPARHYEEWVADLPP